MAQEQVRQAPDEILLERVRKLLALASTGSGATEAEAASALERANHLLATYNLALADVGSQKRTGGTSVRESSIKFGAFKWKAELARAIAEHNFCQVFQEKVERHKVVGYTLLGSPTNLEITTMLIDWVFDQIKRLASTEYQQQPWKKGDWDYVDPLRWHTSFGTGATNRLRERLREIRAAQVAAESEQGEGVRALVISVETDIRDYLEEKYPWRKEQRLAEEEMKRRGDEWWAKRQLEMAAEAEQQKKWREEHPEEAAAKDLALQTQKDAERAEREATWAKERRAREQYEERYYRQHGHYPGEGRRHRAGPVERIDYAVYHRGNRAADDINLAPHVEAPKTPPAERLG